MNHVLGSTAFLSEVADQILDGVIQRMVTGSVVQPICADVEAEAGDTLTDVSAIINATFNGFSVSVALPANVNKINSELIQVASTALAEAVDSSLFDSANGFSFSVGKFGVPVTEAMLDQAETSLFVNRAPLDVPQVLVCTAKHANEIRQMPRFTEFNYGDYGKAFGRIKNSMVYRAQTHTSLMFSRSALFACFYRPKPSFKNNPNVFVREDNRVGLLVEQIGDTFEASMVFACAVTHPEWGVRLL